MVTWADIQGWTHEPLDAAVDEYRRLRGVLETAADDVSSVRDGIESEGATADALRACLDRRRTEVDRLVDQSAQLMMATATAVDGVWNVATWVRECHTTAQIERLTINTDGGVQWSTALTAEYEQRREASSISVDQEALTDFVAHVETARAHLSRRITDIIEYANATDAEYAHALQIIVADQADGIETSGAFSQGLPNLPDASWPPSVVAAWWQALTTAERDSIIANHPDTIGNLNGIDATSRDQANRTRLARLLADAELEYQRELDAYSGYNPYSAYEPHINQKLQKRIKDLRAIKTALEDPAWRNGARLLVLDTTSGTETHAAVALGEVDTATNIGVYTPGMTTTVRDSLHSALDQVSRLRDQSSTDPLLRDVATVAWLGYDAPDVDGNVAVSQKASVGASALSWFNEGIQASRQSSGAADPHLVAFGHSYGSTTTGIMVDHVKDGVVDGMVLFGSPGSGVQDARDYNLPGDGHAYVSGIEHGDAVKGLGFDALFGKDPMTMDGFTHLSDQGPTPDQDGDSLFEHHGDYLEANRDGSSTPILKDLGKVLGGQQ